MAKRILVAALVCMLVLAMAAPVAMAEERVCRGTIGATTVDNLLVPQGAKCTLNGTRVEGSIKVERGAQLFANGVRVKGNVQSQGFRNVVVREASVVVGSVQLENGREGGSGRVIDSKVNGDVQFSTNKARMIARGNTVLGNLQANQNTGGLLISGNSIAENLQCQANYPRPTGTGNTAGDKEDQCAAP